MQEVTYFALENGLRVVHMHEPGTAVGYFGVAVRAGSRDERPDEHGLAHFVEHTIFKGTQRRSSWHIINRMEAVGGELNAFTTKEDTVVYTAFARGNLVRAVELVADLVCNSRFPDRELDKEREVVADEIDSYLDQPAEAVYDDFEDLLFAGTPLGHNILGTKKALRTFDSAKCRSWLDRHYTADNMVAFYAGSTGAATFRALLERHFAGLRPCKVTLSDKSNLSDKSDGSNCSDLSDKATGARFDVVRHIRSHQSNVVMGVALPRCDDMRKRATVAMLSNILGGPGMNSLLNVELRERRGLVYTVETAATFFSDCGMFTVYFGCDPHDVETCRGLVSAQIARLADKPLTDRQLAAWRKQYLGQLVLSNDNRAERAISVARATLMRGRALTAEQITADINAVSAEPLRAAGQRLLDPNILTLGPR